MELKFKNKYQLALDGMIADANAMGGAPDFILVEANEAYFILAEASKLKDKYVQCLKIKRDNIDTSMALWNSNTSTSDIKEITNLWYQRKYIVTYNDIELRIIKQVPKTPEPKFPIGTVRYEYDKTYCKSCGSSLKRKWLFWNGDGCIHPECTNYYLNTPDS